MYRVLVADDEELITDSLAGMLEEASPLELDVYKAYSGSEAFRLLNEISFDIVVSDICMPGMSGIDLAQKIRQKWPKCRVIFQTGYDDFQYAQQAIRQRVAHYILKSEGDEALLEAIGECIDAIEGERDMRNAVAKAKEETRVYKAMLRRNLVQALLYDRKGEAEKQIYEKIELSLNWERPVMLLAARSKEELTDETGLAVDLAIQGEIAYAVQNETAWMDSHVILWALQPGTGENLQHAQAVVKGMAEGICHTIRQMLGISISFVFQETPVPWEQAAPAFERLKQIAAVQMPQMPDSQIAMAGIEYFEEKETEQEKDWACRERSFVNRLTVYIREHIDGDLSLCTLSDKLHLNPSYLSRRFKELTGRTLSETILQIRMETACRLLKTTSCRISEVASMVGYETVANFSKVFKKQMKMTPREYRDLEGEL